MNTEERITKLEKKVAQLSDAFLNAQRQNVPVVSKVDNTANKVVEITPYTDSKTAYIGDTIVTFNCSINGNLSVYVIDNDGNVPTHSIKRSVDFIQIVFDEPLESVANVTISIN